MGDDEQTGDLLMAVARRLRREYAAALVEWDMTPSQSRALRVIERDDGLRLSRLAEALHIAPRSATEVADALQAHGWVGREPDPGDRRATRLLLTPRGREVLTAIEGARRSAGERVLGALGEAQRRTLDAMLRAVLEEDQ